MEQAWLILHRYRWLSWLVFAFGLGALIHTSLHWPDRTTHSSTPVRHVEFPRVEQIPDYLWSPLVPSREPVVQAARNVDDFYRFAGAIKFEGEDGSTLVKAIVDDLKNNRQQMVAPGGSLNGDLTVLEVQDDLMKVEFDQQTLNLGLRFGMAQATAEPQEGRTEPAKGIPFWDRPALERNRYGKRIAEDRWVLERDKLMEYYQEVTNEPQNLLNLFDSFRPDRDEQRKIQGYNLRFRGTQPFLTDMGLQEGDTVKKVNSMPMTSQRRAEWFISEFVRGNMDAFVLDVERDGKVLQKVFIIR